MIIRVDAALPLPVYEQIREQVTRMVVSGTLREGTRLPTIRQLATDLKLAKGTVAKAYALLEDSAIVESKGRKGTFIAPRTVTAPTDLSALSASATSLAVTARQLGVGLDRAIAELREVWVDDE